MSKLRRRRRSCYLELSQGFHRGRCLIESRARIRALYAHPIKKNFCREVLPTGELRLKDAGAAVIAVGSRPGSSRRQKDEGLRRADKALPGCIERQRKVLDLLLAYDRAN